VTCDAGSDRALVRFGYADDDAPRKFAEIPESTDGGLSHRPLSNQNDDEASCLLPSGREVKVRKGIGPIVAYGERTGLPAYRYSVWVDKKRIIHAEDVEKFPFGVIIDETSFRRCDFKLAQDESAYDLTDAATPPVSVPVECGAASPITGEIDTIEYPPTGRSPRVGSIEVKEFGENGGLCQKLIVLGWGEDVVNADDVGGYSNKEWQSIEDIGVSEAISNLLNSTIPQRVYHYTLLDHAHNAKFFVVQRDELSKILSKEALLNIINYDPNKMSGQLLILSGAQTPYKELTNIWLNMVSYNGSQYILALPSPDGGMRGGLPDGNWDNWADPTAVLMKPTPSGQMDEICVFQRVRHF